MLTLVGGPAGMAVVLAALAAPAAAQAGGTPGPSVEGGAQYGTPLVRARPARPVARYFRVGPGYVVSPALPKLALRIDEAGASTVRARIVFMPQTETGSIVRIDLGRIPVGQRVVAAWPAGASLAPGRYRVLLHVRGLRGTVLARKASTPGRATLTVRAPAPAPAPVPDPAGHVFPVSGPHTYGDPFGAPRKGYSHQGQDVLGRRGHAGRRPGRRARSPSPTTRRRPPATTSSRRAPTATTTSSPTARRPRRPVVPTQVVPPASRSATSARPATRPGRTCTSRLGRADGGSMRAHTPSTRCRC